MGLAIVLNTEILLVLILVYTVVYSDNRQHTEKCVLLKDDEHITSQFLC